MHKRGWSNIGVVGAALLALAACGDAAEDAAPAAEIAEDGKPALPAIPVMGPERKIIAFGDSLFAGYNLDPRDSYPEKLENALRAKGMNADVINAGVSGDTSAAGLQRLEFTLAAQETPPALFILELGGNDLLRGLSPEETKANLGKMLTILRDQKVPVLIMGMRAPPNYGPEFQAEFDAIYRDLAKEYGAALIPFWLEDIYREPALFQADKIHPTADGIERLVASTLDEVEGALPPAAK
ncbi:arylesterase [Porphyrobacter sp. SLTP]|uniref:arylesterase n=1 Tax=Porphyrobacter sp. SLTP TaxID=2683266 RepID=UPI001412A6AE|nr:arylesterase [Porphyrobacter sp. SLTP]NBB26510.1 arylesterase [Porphyrobacter sp. SLTP]